MNTIKKLNVEFNGQAVGTLSLTPDNRLNVFKYDKSWIANGFSRWLLKCLKSSEMMPGDY